MIASVFVTIDASAENFQYLLLATQFFQAMNPDRTDQSVSDPTLYWF